MHTHRHYNGLKTALLFGVMWMIFLAFGAALAVAFKSSMFFMGSVLFSLGATFYAYWNSASSALRSMDAYQVTELDAPVLHRIVNELAERAGQPAPTIWISPSETPNAFATGRNPANSAVCCTQGILDMLDERELRGVLGHELMHVYNRDILTSTIAAALGGLVTAAAQASIFFGHRREGNNPLALIGAILMSLLAPFAVLLLRLTISRTREFDADEDGAELTQDPLALASALKKLEAGTLSRPLEPTAEHERVAAMMIANPFRGLGVRRLFATHPPMADRIERLEKMAGY